uniref:PH domain-containing protein n=1 Tax=Timema bartmani TaxID=61472 RepID=A0A7R9I5X4_9NEOP|nr:unnamed protein product [Timema bartmani]
MILVISGWQTRWFILENGVLAYYKSQEEVNQGCKGSMKVSACEIIVNPVDTTRMDLVIPGEQHIYLRAATSQERQQWLVALGSAKACVTTRSRKDSGRNICESNPDNLKFKKSELRLYCDLLMQQVHMVKTAATQDGGPQLKKLDEATSLLGATCDTFIRTLEDCMKICNANLAYEQPLQHTTELALPTIAANQTKAKYYVRSGNEHDSAAQYYVRSDNEHACAAQYYVRSGNEHDYAAQYYVRPGNKHACTAQYYVRSGNQHVSAAQYYVRSGNECVCADQY